MATLDHLKFVERLNRLFGVRLPYDVIQRSWYQKFLDEGFHAADIGAHGGVHSQRMAELVKSSGRVYSFEPLPEQAAALRAQFASHPHVRISEMALSDAPGEAAFFIAQGALEESGLRQRQLNDPGKAYFSEISVRVSTLDSELKSVERLDLLKIDVEGAEMSVLRGAKNTISAHRPVLFVEYGLRAYSVYGTVKADLFDWAVENEYQIHDILGAHYPDRQGWIDAPNGICWDYILLPAERPGGLPDAIDTV